MSARKFQFPASEPKYHLTLPTPSHFHVELEYAAGLRLFGNRQLAEALIGGCDVKRFHIRTAQSWARRLRCRHANRLVWSAIPIEPCDPRGSRLRMAMADIDLPQPLSPTMQTVSPRPTLKDTSRTACTLTACSASASPKDGAPTTCRGRCPKALLFLVM